MRRDYMKMQGLSKQVLNGRTVSPDRQREMDAAFLLNDSEEISQIL